MFLNRKKKKNNIWNTVRFCAEQLYVSKFIHLPWLPVIQWMILYVLTPSLACIEWHAVLRMYFLLTDFYGYLHILFKIITYLKCFKSISLKMMSSFPWSLFYIFQLGTPHFYFSYVFFLTLPSGYWRKEHPWWLTGTTSHLLLEAFSVNGFRIRWVCFLSPIYSWEKFYG